MQKQIKEIIKDINILKINNPNLLEKKVSGIKYNSKKVKEDDIFVCLAGQHTDGTNFIEEAIKNGAKVIVSHKEIPFNFPNDVLYILTDNTNLALAKLSANFYDHPSKKLLMIGVTGTNGKTTITFLLESIFQTAGFKTGVIGTINYRYNNKIIQASNTTPFSSDLQELLYNMVQEKVEVVIMEVSSHSLVQARVKECEFDVAIFSNLSPEHLDYHHNMEEYFKAKSILFKEISPNKKSIFSNSNLGRKVCIINYDDEWGRKLIELCSIKDIILYSKNSKYKNGNRIVASNIRYNANFTEFEILYNLEKKVKICSSLIGEFNIYNILASFSAAYSQNLNVDKIVEGIEKLEGIPGRLEKIPTPLNFNVIIDYAHTPDALQNVILTLKKLPHRRLIVVFGCGGDRDRNKRPIMGAIATQLADYVIVTSDNPRNEDPQRIILDIEVGIKKIGKTNYEIVPDRKQAIFKALSIAGNNDIVLLAGKGHENYQIIGSEKIPFDEREIVKEFFENKHGI
ncbi:MAG: UDP-N-acetylmuramoyl-L-alanyl-D-glutamate--2,6-diaminopimelate ligase [Elusimicrobiota bacterium]|nr:UDP-N-acetylmuramoyl-L-alanyl-D-glutamate--2,6-diaminopimelate ligase [Endomicrobiia bacterium]MCX7910430.1 UDP-N-acetylmuramoyl-L-alanyl-D-glutamate--2,6-diaminopimelate ligase [Endomicrobiia bacterium]MDW8165877.1 UDP-N-acetylmuramoyl-L-alanyl-D-glutamate--2,6-diaminopimelate ligase [Elusimicrobiota bacterium]